jgi:hypothetical protein
MISLLVAVLSAGFALTAAAQSPGAQADPQESRLGAEIRLEREHLAEDCGAIKKLGSCAIGLVTEHPFHVSLGSIAPQNGFGGGPAIVTHFTPKNFRITWSGDAVFAPAGAWRAGTYLKIFRTRIEPPQLAPAGTVARPLRITEYPVYNVYAQAISLPRLLYYGLGPESRRDSQSVYAMSETIVGGSAAIPINAVTPALRLSVAVEAYVRFADVSSGSADAIAPIEAVFTDATAPGLTSQPGFAQFGEGLRMRPWFFNDRLQLGYAVLYQQFVAGDSRFSFQRWTINLDHQIPLYRSGGGPALRDERNTPNECSASSSVHACPGVTRDRWGSIGVRALIVRSQVGDGSEVPFYLQRTLGGSDINGQRALASFDDYRFRGPHLMLFQQTLEHALWGPIGASLSFEQGNVAAQGSPLTFDHLKYSWGIGATVRAGGFPVVNASWHAGGPEGNHFIVSIDTSLLGGGSRTLLQ